MNSKTKDLELIKDVHSRLCVKLSVALAVVIFAFVRIAFNPGLFV